MQYTMEYQQNDKTHAIHHQMTTKRKHLCNTQSNTNKTIDLMQYTIKYRQNDKTHAICNQIVAQR